MIILKNKVENHYFFIFTVRSDRSTNEQIFVNVDHTTAAIPRGQFGQECGKALSDKDSRKISNFF